MNTSAFRANCSQQIATFLPRMSGFSALVGLDGFVDEIIHVVDKRDNAMEFTRIPTIRGLAERIAGAAGKSTNFELVNLRTKLGGNGPIMANALATFGLDVTFVGALGYPHIHPVFEPFSRKAKVFSIAESGHTDALEFRDGKLMFGKLASLNEITWDNIQARFGRDRFIEAFGTAALVAFVNWTMIPMMSEIWEALLKEVCPGLSGRRRKMFFDLADPEKREHDDISQALALISRFQEYFDVTLGLNEKEAGEVAAVLGIERSDGTEKGLARMSQEVHEKLAIDTLVVHPVTYAIAVTDGKVEIVQGPYIAKPVITTGAGDHFNSGFCVGKMLGLENSESLLMGVTASGYYVKNRAKPGTRRPLRNDGNVA